MDPFTILQISARRASGPAPAITLTPVVAKSERVRPHARTAFRRAVDASCMSATWRPELLVEEIPAPQRIAPFVGRA